MIINYKVPAEEDAAAAAAADDDEEQPEVRWCKILLSGKTETERLWRCKYLWRSIHSISYLPTLLLWCHVIYAVRGHNFSEEDETSLFQNICWIKVETLGQGYRDCDSRGRWPRASSLGSLVLSSRDSLSELHSDSSLGTKNMERWLASSSQ